MESWFGKALIKWYLSNKRDLPWRGENDPYKIWLSEIILQQTQVAQGLGYYLKFTGTYPRVSDLAVAPEDEVLKLWQGLGYYSRARNLHSSAKQIHEDHKGVFPTSYPGIRALKGVGDYTAAAIASFAYNLPHAVVDGNVYRLLSRLFGIETPIDSGTGKKEFQELANTLLDRKKPGLHNQAVMEFGSQYCRPANPDCPNCIFNARCVAYNTGRVQRLPVKAKKTKVRDRFFNYIVLVDKKGSIFLKKRGENDIWQGLYEFALIETDTQLSEENLLSSSAFRSLAKDNYNILYRSKTYKHILSHQHLYAAFFVVKVPFVFGSAQLKTNLKDLAGFAFPRLIEKFLEDCRLKDLF